MVETEGFEPLTLRMRTVRSPARVASGRKMEKKIKTKERIEG